MKNSQNRILQDIIDGVQEHGEYEIELAVLQDSVFTETEEIGGAIREQILIWAVGNLLSYKYIERDGKTIVRFSRNKAAR